MNKEKRRVPKLRFPGFTEDWEQRKLGDLLILLKDGSHGTHKNTDEGVYLLSAKNIKNGQINIMPDDRIISWEDYDVIHKNYELQFGDILLTIVGSIGETAIYNLKTKVTFQRSVAFLRPSSDLNNGFLYTLINTDSFQNQLQTKQVVSAQPGIYLGDLASIDIIYPKNLSEQEKIYSIFKEIENSITLHQRKLEHLILKKKALLQKLFPKNGERYPELRFSEFTDAWEQRKFKDLFIERREKTIRENEETLLSCAITGIYLNSELFSHFRGSSTIGYLKIKKYDLILSAQNLHLGNANINLSFDKGMISPAYKVFELKSIDPYFINAWVKKDSTKNFFLKATTEGASQCRKNIEWDVLLNQEIPVPNKLEQRTIGRFINNIDMIITLHQRKLEHLQLQKKALLQQMFV